MNYVNDARIGVSAEVMTLDLRWKDGIRVLSSWDVSIAMSRSAMIQLARYILAAAQPADQAVEQTDSNGDFSGGVEESCGDFAIDHDTPNVTDKAWRERFGVQS